MENKKLEVVYLELLELIKPIITNYYKKGINVFLCNKIQLKDLQQEVFLEIWETLVKNRIDVNILDKYIVSLTTNKLATLYTQAKIQIQRFKRLNLIQEDIVNNDSNNFNLLIDVDLKIMLEEKEYNMLKKYLQGYTLEEIGKKNNSSKRMCHYKLQKIFKKIKNKL